MVFTTGTIISAIGIGLNVLGSVTGFIGGSIKAKEKEAREIDELDNRNEGRWNKWIADKSSKD